MELSRINEKIAKLENEIKALKIEKAEIENSQTQKTLNKKEAGVFAKEIKEIFKNVLGVSGRAPKYSTGRESAVVFGVYAEKQQGAKRGVYCIEAGIGQTNNFKDFSKQTIAELKKQISEVAVVTDYKFEKGADLTSQSTGSEKGDNISWIITAKK